MQTFLNCEEQRLYLVKELAATSWRTVEVYYKRWLKLVNCLQVKATNVFLTTIFRVGLEPYLRLTSMARNTFLKHKEVVVIYEESGPHSKL